MSARYISSNWRLLNQENSIKSDNYGLTFDGSELIDCGSPTLFDDLTSFSFSCWFNSDLKSQDRGILGKWLTGSNRSFALNLETSGNIRFIVRSGGAAAQSYINTSDWSTGNWYNIIGTYDGSNVKIYLDGVLKDTVALTGTVDNATQSFRIGVYGSASYFDGKISEVAIFDYALSSTQISTLYGSSELGSTSPMALKPAPVAFYPLGDNSASNPLTQPNEAVEDASVFNFDSDVIEVSNSSDLRITGNMTLSAWINSNNISSSQVLIQKNGGGGRNYQFWLLGSKLRLNTATEGAFSNTTLQSNRWYHVAISVIDGTGTFYVDGVADGSSTFTVTPPATNQPFYIGRSYSPAAYYYFDGEMSNVQVWAAGLSSTEIETLYNSGVPLTGTQPQESNLKAWYKLDQSANWEADSSGNWQIPDAVSSYPQSFDFDGSGEHIDVSSFDNAILSDGDISFSLWCKLTSTGTYQYILSSEHTGTISGINIAMHPNTKLSFSRAQDIANTQNGTGYTVLGFSLGSWHHLCGTYNATSGELKAYVDGDLKSTTNDSADARTASAALKIGGLSTYATLYAAKGQISNAQIWNTTLSDTQVETLYNNGVPLTTAIATDNLKAWYKLNDNEKFDGTNWSVENQKYPAGFDSALDFVAVDSDYIDLGTDSSLDIFGGDFSVSLWFKHSISSPSKQPLIEIAYFSNKMALTLGLSGNTGVGFAVGSGTPVWNFNAGSGYNDGNWHHMVATKTGTTYKIYVDDAELSFSTGAWAVGSNNRIATGRSSPVYFNGELSNIAIFNTTLDSAAITALYNNGTPETSISSSPVSWWKLDNTTTGIQDSVGSNDGTNNGATKVNTFVSTEAATSSGMTEQNLVNNNVSTLNGESSGMTSANLVLSDLTRAVPYDSYSFNFDSPSSDYITTGFSIGAISQYSFSVWFKMDSAPAAYSFIYADANSSGQGASARAGIGFYQNFFFATMGNGSSVYSDQTSYNISAAYDNNWHHIGLIIDGTKQRLYLDGSLVHTYTSSISAGTAGTQDYTIGRYGDFNGHYFDGGVSNLSIFNQALTSTEVLKLYANGVPQDLASFSPAPVAWWPLGSNSFWNGSAWTCRDIIGSNDGTGQNIGIDGLVGDSPRSTGNGTGTNMDVPSNLEGSTKWSSNNIWSINMSSEARKEYTP